MNPNQPDDDARGAGEPGDAQEVGLDDVEVSAEPVGSRLPPPLPPSASLVPQQTSQPPQQYSQPPQSPSMAPSMAPQPAAASRSPLFYVGILLGVLVVGLAIGAVVSFRRPKPIVQQAPSASPGQKVITIPVVDMDDSPDGGP